MPGHTQLCILVYHTNSHSENIIETFIVLWEQVWYLTYVNSISKSIFLKHYLLSGPHLPQRKLIFHFNEENMSHQSGNPLPPKILIFIFTCLYVYHLHFAFFLNERGRYSLIQDKFFQFLITFLPTSGSDFISIHHHSFMYFFFYNFFPPISS